MPYNCLYLNKGNNSSVKGSILTKLIGYQEFIVLIICTKNELNLTGRYWDMVPDRQKVRTDGRTDGMDGGTDGRTDDAKTISLRLCRGIISLQVDLLMMSSPPFLENPLAIDDYRSHVETRKGTPYHCTRCSILPCDMYFICAASFQLRNSKWLDGWLRMGLLPPPREFCRHILSCRELKAESFKRCLHSVLRGVSL